MRGPILVTEEHNMARLKETKMSDQQLDFPAVALNASDEADLHAYNAAFGELGLRWRWDAQTYRGLQRIAGEKSRIGAYVENEQPHLLKAYDKGFLCELIYATKERCHREMNRMAA